jgi:hypothetical protein
MARVHLLKGWVDRMALSQLGSSAKRDFRSEIADFQFLESEPDRGTQDQQAACRTVKTIIGKAAASEDPRRTLLGTSRV